MKIVTPTDFLSVLKGNYLLLDTNVFIDDLIHPNEFGQFFNNLKDNDVTLVTVHAVLAEFVKGATDEKKLAEKREIIEKIIETYLPFREDAYNDLIKLIGNMQEDGKTASITDLMLGTMLMQYPRKLLLMSKNITDFPTNIFTLRTFCHLVHRKTIHIYGI